MKSFLKTTIVLAALWSSLAHAQSSEEVGLVAVLKPAAIADALKIDSRFAPALLRSIIPLGEERMQADVVSVVVMLPNDPSFTRPKAVKYTMSRKHDFADIVLSWTDFSDLSQLEEIQHQGKTLLVDKTQREAGLAFWQMDDQTLLVDSLPELKSRIEGDVQTIPFIDSQWSKAVKTSHITVAFSGDYIRAMGPPPPEGGPGGELEERIVSTNKLMRDNLHTGIISLEINDQLNLNASFTCKTDAGADALAEELAADQKFGRAALAAMQGMLKDNPDAPAMQKIGVDLGAELLANLKLETQAKTISVGTSATTPENVQRAYLDPAIQDAARNSAYRSQSVNNSKIIVLGMHNHHDTQRRFPPAVLKSKSGHAYSWRVAILPYIDEKELYDRYKFDEPWDSEANKKLIPLIPDTYRHPSDKTRKGYTAYFAVVGENTMFTPDNVAKRFSSATDGASNTVMIVEAKRDIPWTKPVDLEYSSDKPLPEFGGFFVEGFVAAIADGSTRFLTKETDAAVLRSYLERNDGK